MSHNTFGSFEFLLRKHGIVWNIAFDIFHVMELEWMELDCSCKIACPLDPKHSVIECDAACSIGLPWQTCCTAGIHTVAFGTVAHVRFFPFQPRTIACIGHNRTQICCLHTEHLLSSLTLDVLGVAGVVHHMVCDDNHFHTSSTWWTWLHSISDFVAFEHSMTNLYGIDWFWLWNVECEFLSKRVWHCNHSDRIESWANPLHRLRIHFQFWPLVSHEPQQHSQCSNCCHHIHHWLRHHRHSIASHLHSSHDLRWPLALENVVRHFQRSNQPFHLNGEHCFRPLISRNFHDVAHFDDRHWVRLCSITKWNTTKLRKRNDKLVWSKVFNSKLTVTWGIRSGADLAAMYWCTGTWRHLQKLFIESFELDDVVAYIQSMEHIWRQWNKRMFFTKGTKANGIWFRWRNGEWVYLRADSFKKCWRNSSSNGRPIAAKLWLIFRNQIVDSRSNNSNKCCKCGFQSLEFIFYVWFIRREIKLLLEKDLLNEKLMNDLQSSRFTCDSYRRLC